MYTDAGTGTVVGMGTIGTMVQRYGAACRSRMRTPRQLADWE